MTRILIKEGQADSNYPNSMGIPPLFYVFEEWREQILYKIPGKDSLITMLSRAVEMIEILGIAGANVNAVGLGGETPVHVAAGLGQARHLFLLCKFGFECKDRCSCCTSHVVEVGDFDHGGNVIKKLYVSRFECCESWFVL